MESPSVALRSAPKQLIKEVATHKSARLACLGGLLAGPADSGPAPPKHAEAATDMILPATGTE
jgi:hypothetical protein